jgi:hypothetical protein
MRNQIPRTDGPKPLAKWGPFVLFFGPLLLFFLNAIDAGATAYFVSKGWAQEANPLMSYLLDQGVCWFLGVKSLVGLLILLWLPRMYELKGARRAVFALNVIYGLIVLWHLTIGAFILGGFGSQ